MSKIDRNDSSSRRNTLKAEKQENYNLIGRNVNISRTNENKNSKIINIKNKEFLKENFRYDLYVKKGKNKQVLDLSKTN